MARIITLIITGGFAAMFLYVGITQFIQQRRSLANAERIDATIIHSAVVTTTSKDTDSSIGGSNNTTTHRPDVRFRYVVAGSEYESDLLNPNIIVQGYASAESAAEALVPYPLNAKVRAYVDPTYPEQAFLVAESTNGPIVFIVLGLILPPIGWFVGKFV